MTHTRRTFFAHVVAAALATSASLSAGVAVAQGAGGNIGTAQTKTNGARS